MTFLKEKYNFILIVTLISLSKGQDPASDFLPDIAAFPDGPPTPGDPFEDPSVVVNPGDEALGDILATDPDVGDLTPPASLVSDGADVQTNETAVISDQSYTPKEDPSVGGEALVDPETAGDGGIITGPEAVETNPGETALVESGTGILPVGDPGMGAEVLEIATPPVGPTTTTAPVTTVDFNFNLNETFDGRNDLLLLTATKPTTNESTVASPSENIDNASTVINTTSDILEEDMVHTESPTIIEGAESKTMSTAPDSEIAPSLIGESSATEITEDNTTYPSTDANTTELTSDLENQTIDSQSMVVLDSTSIPDENTTASSPIQSPEMDNDLSTAEEHTVHNHTVVSDKVGREESQNVSHTDNATDTANEIPGTVNTTEITNTTEELLSEYEKKQKEFNTFVEANPDTNFPGPPSPPPSLNTQPELPPESDPQIAATDSAPKLPPAPPSPRSETLDTVPSNQTAQITPGSETVDKAPSIKAPSPTTGSEASDKVASIQTAPTIPGSETVDKTPSIQATIPDSVKDTSTSPPQPKTQGPTKDVKPSYQVIDYPIAPPPPPPPPSNVFKTDFGEVIASTAKPTAFVYEPEIPYDPDFDYRPPENTNKVKQVISTERPPNRRIASPRTTSSLKKNAYAFVFDESRNQPRNQPKNRPSGGISLLQYQHNNRKNVGKSRQSPTARNNARYRLSDRRQIQNSNSVQALFDKNTKFVAKFGEPGMPFYQEFFEQQPKAFFSAEPTKSKPFDVGLGSNRVNNAEPFYPTNDRMPPIRVQEDAPVSQRRNTLSETRGTAMPAAARFQTRNINNPQLSRTNPPFTASKLDNSYEFWYQLMGKDLQNNRIRNQNTAPNAYENPINMGGKVLNRFWSVANPGRKRGGIETNPPRNVLNSNKQIHQTVEAGSLKPKETVRNKNAYVFEPQMQNYPVGIANPHRMKIKEYTITNNPNLISTTEARLNMGIPTLSKPLESEQLSNVMYSLENPPPINIDAEIPNVAFQAFPTTTVNPNTLPQPTMPSVAAFRMEQRRVDTPTVRSETQDRAFRASSVQNPPIPPPIQPLATEYIPSINDFSPVKPLAESVNTVSIKRTETKRQTIRNVPDVKAIPNAVPYVPAEPMRRPRENSLFDLPRPPAISVGSSSASKAVVENIDLPPPIKDARPLHQTTTASYIQEPDLTPVPPMFSINSTIVMKLQNDSVTKEELPSSVCHQCHYVSDVCFLSEAGICNRFVECHRSVDHVRAFEKECAIGNFWNPETLACQKSLYVNCTADPCRNPAVKSHPFLGRCRYFWKCNRGRSEFEFCGQNYRYDGISDTCVPDFQCKDEDPPNDVIIPESPPEKCLWTAVHGSLDSFTDGYFVQKCAPGTRFDEVQCTCVISNILPEGEICNPDTVIDFEGEDPVAFKDKSGHMNGIGKENVRVKNNTGFFYGIGKLSFWRYSNVELGPLLAIQIRFFPYGYSKNLMALVSNCNGSPIGATVDIRLNTSSNLATFKLSTNKQLNNFISLPYEPFQWNTAIYVYAGDTFTASINDKKETIPVEGSIPNRHPAIQVGGCNRNDGFRGYADDIKVYNGCIPEEFEYIIFT